MVADIVSRIPIKTIARCKCVCKRWHRLLSEPYFTNLHLSSSPAGLLIRRDDRKTYDFFELTEQDDKSDHHAIYHDPLMSFDTGLSPGDGYLSLCGSVNGLICVSKHKAQACVFNIVTREYICLPVHKYIRKNQDTTPKYGFGFVKASNEYKVVCFYDPSTEGSWCEVYTLGTGMWRSLGHVPFFVDPDHLGALHFWKIRRDGLFFSGNLHWLVYDTKDTNHEKVCTLDLKKEVFQLTACPQVGEKVDFRQLGMLRECLCVCDTRDGSELVIWAMKDYGMKESWSKEIVIQEQYPRYLYASPHPLKAFEDGTILLSYYFGLFTYDPRDKSFNRVNFLRKRNLSRQDVEVVFVPSFIRLQSFMLEKVSVF